MLYDSHIECPDTEEKGVAKKAKAITPGAWINQIFMAGQANQGNVVRRSMHDVQRYASPQALEAAVRERGFHMALVGNQYVIVCNPDGQIAIVC
jgi:hypothetical protein